MIKRDLNICRDNIDILTLGQNNVGSSLGRARLPVWVWAPYIILDFYRFETSFRCRHRSTGWPSRIFLHNRCIRVIKSCKHSHFQCSKVRRQKSAFSQIMYLGCVWKWIRSREQNSVPESRHASLYCLKVIKMSRLTIDRFFILWSLHGSLCCCIGDRERDMHNFSVLRHARWWERTSPMCPKPCLF